MGTVHVLPWEVTVTARRRFWVLIYLEPRLSRQVARDVVAGRLDFAAVQARLTAGRRIDSCTGY